MAIVVGFIPTPEGQAALARAASEARLRRTTLIVVNSDDPAQKKDASAVARLEQELAAAVARLAEDGLDHEVRTFDRGRLPSEELLAVADDVAADLIVIGLRRRSPVGKLLLGSHAQEILLDAEHPVLAVKASS